MAFLPKDYKLPDAKSGYMKLKQGANRFRVLGSAIVGNETWTEDEDGNRKPLRFRVGQSIPVEKIGTDPKHFWAFVVWNYQEEQVQILELTQKGIMSSIKNMVDDDDWGDPKEYDIVINRVGEGLETEYSTNPKPKSELDEGIGKYYEDLNINLDALFAGEDPFASTGEITEEELDSIASEIDNA